MARANKKPGAASRPGFRRASRECLFVDESRYIVNKSQVAFSRAEANEPIGPSLLNESDSVRIAPEADFEECRRYQGRRTAGNDRRELTADRGAAVTQSRREALGDERCLRPVLHGVRDERGDNGDEDQ